MNQNLTIEGIDFLMQSVFPRKIFEEPIVYLVDDNHMIQGMFQNYKLFVSPDYYERIQKIPSEELDNFVGSRLGSLFYKQAGVDIIVSDLFPMIDGTWERELAQLKKDAMLVNIERV